MGRNNNTSYVYIKAWGYYLGSFDYYIRDQRDRAAKAGAPADAIFERHDANGPTGEWATFSGLNEQKQRDVQRVASQRGCEVELMLKDAA